MARWTTETEQQLRTQVAQWQQRCAHYEGKCAALVETIELLKTDAQLQAAKDRIGVLEAQVKDLLAEQRECLKRATAPVPVLPWPDGVRR